MATNENLAISELPERSRSHALIPVGSCDYTITNAPTTSASYPPVMKALAFVFGITNMALSLRDAFGSISYDGTDFLIATVVSFAYVAVFKGLQSHFDKIQRQSQSNETDFRTLRQDLNVRLTTLQIQYATQVEANETSKARSTESLNRLQAAYDRLQMDYNAIRATSTADIATLQTAHDRLRSEYAALESMRAADIRALQTAHDNLKTEFNALQTANTTLTARYNQLSDTYNSYRVQYDDIRAQFDKLYINAPENARFLLANNHTMISDVRLTKDRRPDLRCRQFSDLGTNVSWVLHDGRRVCIMIRTFSE